MLGASRAVRGLATAAAAALPAFETLLLSQAAPAVLQVALNRPSKHNAMNRVFWDEITQAFDWAAEAEEFRAVRNGGNVAASDRCPPPHTAATGHGARDYGMVCEAWRRDTSKHQPHCRFIGC